MNLRRKILLSFCSIALTAGGIFLFTTFRTDSHKVLFTNENFRFSTFRLTGGYSHAIWNAEPWEIKLNKIPGNTYFKRWLTPGSYLETKTDKPALGFTVRFKGEISMNELLKLKAELVTDAGTYNLTPAASTRDIKKKSFMKFIKRKGK